MSILGALRAETNVADIRRSHGGSQGPFWDGYVAGLGFAIALLDIAAEKAPFNLDDIRPEDQHGTPCRRAGHVPGCAGQSGGDHELLPGWISYDDGEGNLIEVEVAP